MWWWWLACADAPNDRELYLQSLEAEPTEAVATCVQIEDEILRGECITVVAGKAAKAGEDTQSAFAPCAALEDPLWSAECWFWVTDSLQLTGDEAVDSCKNAGQWRPNCLGHAVGREMRAMEKKHDVVGQEDLLLTEIGVIIQRYKPNAPKPQQAVAARATLAQIIRARWKDSAFDQQLCGVAEPEVCALAYRGTLDLDPNRVVVADVCAAPITLERVAELGARPWTAGSEALAIQAWADWCEAQQRQGPDGNRPPPGPGGPNPPSMLDQFFGEAPPMGPPPARRDRPPSPGEGKGE